MKTLCNTMVSLMILMCSLSLAQSVATLTRFEGDVTLLKKSRGELITARPGSVLGVGDELATKLESFAEVRYTNGAVLRMDENTTIMIASATEKSFTTTTPLGKVWINMQKITKKGTEFSVASPTATAAIRGTVFALGTTADSTTDVAVFDGKVAVGPTRLQGTSAPAGIRTEIAGPAEVAGPYEVSLESWKLIVAGQQITVRKDGKCAQSAFTKKSKESDAFIAKNVKLDKELLGI